MNVSGCCKSRRDGIVAASWRRYSHRAPIGILAGPRNRAGTIRTVDRRRLSEVFVRELDTCGLACPLPLLKAKQALNAMASGETLRVRATDRGSWRDFRAFAEQSGHTLLESSELEGVFTYVLQKR
jgi:tRNA 2-thiouridine synthesizing protein A